MKIILPILMIISILAGCKDEVTAINDEAQQRTALKKVTVRYDSLTLTFSDFLSGDSDLSTLKENDPDYYSDPVNYFVTLDVNTTVDNTADGAEDATFDGLKVNLVMDTIKNEKIAMVAAGFEIKKDESLNKAVTGTINAATHGNAMRYIFQQMVDGEDIATSLTPVLEFNLGVIDEEYALVTLQKDIPTRASDEMKAFLQQVLDSDILP